MPQLRGNDPILGLNIRTRSMISVNPYSHPSLLNPTTKT
jgi:hypothetical protein